MNPPDAWTSGEFRRDPASVWTTGKRRPRQRNEIRYFQIMARGYGTSLRVGELDSMDWCNKDGVFMRSPIGHALLRIVAGARIENKATSMTRGHRREWLEAVKLFRLSYCVDLGKLP